ncbi:hypothetical protein ACFVJ9_54735, partial [Streptomyces sp. NPDC127574]
MTFTHDLDQIAQANTSGRTPVVFVHGLWLLPGSWDRWAALFADAGGPPVPVPAHAVPSRDQDPRAAPPPAPPDRCAAIP